jgi:hypothetical protein
MNVFKKNTAFSFSTEPFPAFRCDLTYGRNKKDFAFLPCNVAGGDLQDGKFKVIKTQAKGTIMVVDGTDETNKILLFVGISDGFRGSSGIEEKSEDVQIISQAQARSACDGQSEYICILPESGSISLYSRGRRTDYIVEYTNKNGQLVETRYERSEWNTYKAIGQEQEEEFETL